MLVGHFAVSLLGKRAAPNVSLGTLTLASLLPDLLWCVLMIAGVEGVRFKAGFSPTPGMRAVAVLEPSEIAYSHSLLTVVIWGGLLALFFFALRRNRKDAAVLMLAVVSHWLLDWVSHPPDLPLAPWTSRRFGLGLWNSIPFTLVIEGAFWVFAVWSYQRNLRRQVRARRYGFWATIVVLTVIWYGNIAGPPPEDPSTIGISSLVFFALAVCATYAVERRIDVNRADAVS